MKFILTGGHITPALAVASEIKKKGDEVIFVGRKNTYESDTKPSFEYCEIKKLGYKFINLKAGRLTRIMSLKSIANIFTIPIGFYHSFKILTNERPGAIISFGGYLSFPICVVGYVLRIPIFIHEQTIAPGLANRIIGTFAKKVFVSFPQTVKVFNNKKTLLTGNPIRLGVFKKGDIEEDIDKTKPVILVLGGSLGSHSINVIIERCVDKLCQNFTVIHQTGNVFEYRDFQRLSSKKIKNYYVKEHIPGEFYGSYLSIADLVVSRAGANTLFELIALQKPAILIPLPWASGNEQLKHALLLQDVGAARLFSQDKTPEELVGMIQSVISERAVYKKNFQKLSDLAKTDASVVIVNSIYEALHNY